MKNLFLSLAVIATLTVVSCKQTASDATPAVDSTMVEAPVVNDSMAAPATDSMAAPATTPEVAPATAPAPAAAPAPAKK